MRTIGFYVSPGFQMLDLAGPAGAFEAANDRLESPAYRLHVLAADKGAVTSSLGVAITGASLDDAVLDTLVVTGGQIDPLLSAGTLSRIVETSRRCRRVVSVCTGAFALAAAGLLDGLERYLVGDPTDLDRASLDFVGTNQPELLETFPLSLLRTAQMKGGRDTVRSLDDNGRLRAKIDGGQGADNLFVDGWRSSVVIDLASRRFTVAREDGLGCLGEPAGIRVVERREHPAIPRQHLSRRRPGGLPGRRSLPRATDEVLILVALLAFVSLALTACGDTTASQDPSKIRVGIVFDIGGKDDLLKIGRDLACRVDAMPLLIRSQRRSGDPARLIDNLGAHA